MEWIGRNIRALRRRRGWTLARLARETGLSAVPLGRIERGEHIPSTRALVGLARALGASLDALCAEGGAERDRALRGSGGGGPAPVALDGEDAGWPPAAGALARELTAALHALEDLAGVPKHARIPLCYPFEPSWRGLEELAGTVRRALGVADGVLFDYLELFENAGLRVVHLPLPTGLDGFSWLDPAHQNAFFFLHSRCGPERRLFRLAWELGKVLLLNAEHQHGGPLFPRQAELPDGTGAAAGPGGETPAGRAAGDPGGAGWVDLAPAGALGGSSGDSPRRRRTLTADRAARRFAATFLMPAPAVRDSVGQLGLAAGAWDLELLLRLKHRFGVSAESFLYRLGELGLIAPDRLADLKRSIYEGYAREDFAEPGDSRRILTPNGRLWDLVCVVRRLSPPPAELADIESLLRRLEVERV